MGLGVFADSSDVVVPLMGIITTVVCGMTAAIVWALKRLATWPERAIKEFRDAARESREQSDRHFEVVIDNCTRSHGEIISNLMRQGRHIHDMKDQLFALSIAAAHAKALTPEGETRIVDSINRRRAACEREDAATDAKEAEIWKARMQRHSEDDS